MNRVNVGVDIILTILHSATTQSFSNFLSKSRSNNTIQNRIDTVIHKSKIVDDDMEDGASIMSN